MVEGAFATRADEGGGAVVDGGVDPGFDAEGGGFVDHGADVGGFVEGVAELEFLGGGDEEGDGLVGDGRM